MRAVVATAQMFGRKVAAHAHGVDGVNAALRAGVDSIEHGTFTNDETFRLYKQTGAYYVPTLLAPAAALADGKRGALTAAQYRKGAAGRRQCREELRARRSARASRSPSAPTPASARMADNAEEFALMVKNGMSPGAGDPLGHGRCRRTARPCRHGSARSRRQGRGHHRGRRRSDCRRPAARECRLRDEARAASTSSAASAQLTARTSRR